MRQGRRATPAQGGRRTTARSAASRRSSRRSPASPVTVVAGARLAVRSTRNRAATPYGAMSRGQRDRFREPFTERIRRGGSASLPAVVRSRRHRQRPGGATHRAYTRVFGLKIEALTLRSIQTPCTGECRLTWSTCAGPTPTSRDEYLRRCEVGRGRAVLWSARTDDPSSLTLHNSAHSGQRPLVAPTSLCNAQRQSAQHPLAASTP